MEVRVSADPGALAVEAARHLASAVADAVRARGRAAIALSGGSTPGAMFDALSAQPPDSVPWARCDVFQVDERVAPAGSAERNATDLRARLVERVGLPAERLHLMDVEADDLDAAAAAYDRLIDTVAGGPLDVVHLGLGDDGHTASWPPGDPVVDLPGDVAVVGPFRGHRRMTLTPNAVNRARSLLWLVSGAAKAPVLRRLVDGDPTIPASRAERARAVVFADRAAAADLPPGRA